MLSWLPLKHEHARHETHESIYYCFGSIETGFTLFGPYDKPIKPYSKELIRATNFIKLSVTLEDTNSSNPHGRFVLVTGNFMAGFRFFGPFIDIETLHQWRDNRVSKVNGLYVIWGSLDD